MDDAAAATRAVRDGAEALSRGDFAGAVIFLESAISRWDRSDYRGYPYADALVHLADCHILTGQVAKVVIFLEQSLTALARLDPDDSKVSILRLECFQRLGMAFDRLGRGVRRFRQTHSTWRSQYALGIRFISPMR